MAAIAKCFLLYFAKNFGMAGCPFLVFFVIFHLLLISFAKEERQPNPNCPYFHCGKLGHIGFPFSNRTHPECGLMVVDGYDKQVQKIQLAKEGPRYNLTNIAQDNSITLEDQAFQNQLNGRSCESLKNMTFPSSPILSFQIISNLSLFRCTHKLDSNLTKFNFPCNGSFIYYNHKDDHLPSIIPPSCSLIQLPVNKSGESLFNMLTSVFTLQVIVPTECFGCHWIGGHCQIESKGKFNCTESRECNDCHSKGGHCGIDENKSFQCENISTGHGNKLKLRLGLGTGAGFCILSIIAIYVRIKISSDNPIIFWKKKNENYRKIEVFLRNYGSLAPKRYSYSDIKKMTNSFKHKLGQGGYGAVYKGKLLDGRNVAVKVLNETKGNGEDFINEVGSISRTSHVNIVTLLGFCFEGHRRALVYEFVYNGSLDKFIYRNSSLMENYKLNWETLYQIAVGVARGLEYLHRGCGTRIMHFDVKPHNILLDEDFCPKISDFGLAKTCQRKESMISMSVARGTVGYIAPEVFCRTIGEVSYKSDVYSYGMMVFEMTGGRKNSDLGGNHSSDVYFPHWIYKRLETDEELGLQGIENEEDREYAMKMIIVSLWCIQTNPSDRPTMTRVVEMLEGSLDSLQIPPKPFLSSPGSPAPALADSSTTHSMLTL